MLKNGAHVKIDDDDFLIDTSVTDHYAHRFRDLQPQKLEITGAPNKAQLDGESLMWMYDDWAGGEGNRIYYSDEPDIYNAGYELNPRVRGQITGRPDRGRVTITAADRSSRTLMTVGDGAVWIGGGYNLAFSRGAPGTWTEKSDAEVGLQGLSSSYRMTALIGDHEWVYYSGWHSGSSGSRVLLQCHRSDSGSPNTVVTEATGKAPYADLAMMNGKLYAWTGRKLYEHDVDQSFALAADKIRKVFDTGIDPSSSNVFTQDWWAEAKATENSIIFWYSTEGQTEVYEYKKGVGRPIWRPPFGFTIKGSIYQNGIMYFSGHWGGDSVLNGWAALYALPLDSYRPIALKTPRKFQNTFANGAQMQDMAQSYGMQILMANTKQGQLFVYDTDADGFSMLDDLTRASGADPDGVTYTTDQRVAGIATLGPYRYFGVYSPGLSNASGTYQIVYYKDDEPDQRQKGLNATNFTGHSGFLVESAKWDYDYPMEQKLLIGFHVTMKPMVSGQNIDLSYSIDDGVNFTSLSQITSSTSGATVGRVFIPVSTVSAQKKFHQLVWRMALTSSDNVYTPIVYGVTAEAKLTRKREEWEIVVRLKDDQSRTRPLDRQALGNTMRDQLEATCKAGSLVTFQDGFRYKDTGVYSTHSVTIKEVEDVVDNLAGQGTMRILLVAATEAT